MMDRVEIGPHVLYCADVMDVAGELNGVGDLLVTDPPYALTSGGKNTGEFRGIFATGKYDNSGEIMTRTMDWPETMTVLHGLTKPDSDAYVMCNDKNVRDALNAAHDARWKFHNLLVWQKNNVIPNRWYSKHLEFVMYLYKGKAKAINNKSSRQLSAVNNSKECGHPTGKPVELLLQYIENSSQPGDVVIDPFMGRGSTGAACVRSCRRFIGVEIDSEHFEKACERIEREVKMKEAV